MYVTAVLQAPPTVRKRKFSTTGKKDSLKDYIEPTCSEEEGLLTHAVPRQLCGENLSDVESLCQYKIWKRIWKKSDEPSLCPHGGPRLILIVPSAIDPSFANNDWNEPYLITVLGSVPRPRLHLIRFSGVLAPNAA